MKKQIFQLSASFVCLATSAATASADTVALFLDLDDSGTPLARVSRDDPRLSERAAVLQPELAREGWMWGEFTDTFDVYIPDEDIGKDLEPVDGARLHLEPDPLGTVLARAGPNDRVEVTDSGPMWTARVIDKTVPVYYTRPPVETERAPEPPARDPSAPTADSAAPVVTPATPSAREPEQIRLIDEVVRAEPRAAPPPERRAERERTDRVAVGIARPFEGTFREVRRTIFRPAPTRYEIVDRRGRRVAWVDLSDAILHQGVGEFLDREVTVHGTWEKATDRPEIVVRARNIRAR